MPVKFVAIVSQMSDSARVVIIGGGIAGVSAAYHLCLRGWTDVLLLERDELSSGSTWHAAGNVPTFSGNWALMRMQQYSAALYRRLAEDIKSPISYHVTGSVPLAHTAEAIVEVHHHRPMARGNWDGVKRPAPRQVGSPLPALPPARLGGAL